jgi:hypothetical protein
MLQIVRFSTPIVIGLPLKSVDINLSCLHLKGQHLKLSYSNLPLADISLRSKYLFMLLNLATLAKMQ